MHTKLHNLYNITCRLAKVMKYIYYGRHEMHGTNHTYTECLSQCYVCTGVQELIIEFQCHYTH